MSYRKFRRQNGVVAGDVSIGAFGAMLQLGGHAVRQRLSVEPLRCEVDTGGLSRRLGLLNGKHGTPPIYRM